MIATAQTVEVTSASASLLVIAIVAGLSLIGSVAVAVIPRLGRLADRRREQYGDAVAALVAWSEFPYRVARRTSDGPKTLGLIAEEAHTLQERLAFSGAWVTSESGRVGEIYKSAADLIRDEVRPAIRKAWKGKCADTPKRMNIGDLGVDLDRVRSAIGTVENAIRWRFRSRRSVYLFGRWLSEDLKPPEATEHSESAD